MSWGGWGVRHQLLYGLSGEGERWYGGCLFLVLFGTHCLFLKKKFNFVLQCVVREFIVLAVFPKKKIVLLQWKFHTL